MAWFSYFLLSVPEAFLLLAVSFALFGISIKEHLKNMIIFALLLGGITFILSIFMDNSLKAVLNILAFTLLVVVLFRLKILHGFILSVIGFILLLLFEIVLLIPLTNVIPFEQIIASPWLRILFGLLTIHIPLLLTLFIIQKFKLTIKIPLLK